MDPRILEAGKKLSLFGVLPPAKLGSASPKSITLEHFPENSKLEQLRGFIEKNETQKALSLIQSMTDEELKGQTEKKRQTILFQAAASGNLAILGTLLFKVDAKIPDVDRHTPLMVAATRTDPVAAPSSSADKANDKSKAQSINHLDALKLLASSPGGEASLESVGHDGYSAALYAVKHNNKEALKVLLEAGANANVKDKEKKPLLFNAIDQAEPKMVELLMKNGANPHARYFKRELDEEAMEGVVKARAVNALEYIVVSDLKFHKEMIHVLVENGVDINGRNELGVPAIAVAAAVGKVDLIKILMDQGADPNVADNRGKTALAHRVDVMRRDDKVRLDDVAKLLVENGVNITGTIVKESFQTNDGDGFVIERSFVDLLVESEDSNGLKYLYDNGYLPASSLSDEMKDILWPPSKEEEEQRLQDAVDIINNAPDPPPPGKKKPNAGIQF